MKQLRNLKGFLFQQEGLEFKFLKKSIDQYQDNKRFLIICAARTGSTMLRWMLNSHPKICCHGEVFSLPSIRGFVGISDDETAPIFHMLQKIRSMDPVSFLEHYVFCPGQFPVVGAKIQYASLQEPAWKSLFKKILSDYDIRIVHLIRENKLKRFVSHYIAAQKTHVNLALTRDQIPQPVRITLSPEECINDLIETEKAENRFREFFKIHQVFEITYEQILDSKSYKLNELQNFLGVVPTKLKMKTLKLNSDNLKDLIENYHELKNKFLGTKFELYLTELEK